MPLLVSLAEQSSLAVVTHTDGHVEPELRQTNPVTAAPATENFPTSSTVMAASRESEFDSTFHTPLSLVILHPLGRVKLPERTVYHASAGDGRSRGRPQEIQNAFPAFVSASSTTV